MKKKAKNPMSILGKLIKLILENYPVTFVIVVICIFISAVSSSIGTYFIKDIIEYIDPLKQQADLGLAVDYSPLVKELLKMLFVYVAGIISTYIYSRLMVNVAQGTLKDIRNRMFNHMQTLPIKYFDTHSHGDIMSRYTNDTDTLRQMLSQSIPQILSSIFQVVALTVLMLMLNVILTILMMIMVVVMIFITRYIGSRSGRNFVLQQIAIGNLNGYIEEMIEGQRVIKVFCHEEHAKKDFDKLNEELCRDATKANVYASILMPVLGNLSYFNYAFTAILGGYLAIYGVLGFNIAKLIPFLQFSRQFSMPISQISQQFNLIVMALAGAERIFELLDEKPEEDLGTVTLVDVKIENDTLVEASEKTGIWAWKRVSNDGTITYKQVLGDVRFKDVDFGYRDDKIVLHNVSLFAKPGQKIAFVGATGAGKTTITNLINRFYDIQEGQIIFDGIGIKEIKKADLRRALGIVLQDTSLFTGTIKENIKYGKLDATDEEVYEACKLANADSFIQTLKDGYDTVITGNGDSLSQGQRQLLSIARAAIANPPVLILDEATSSIDTYTEKLITEGMDRLMHGRTVFVIAHRLSTVQNSDAIMVLELGNIIERGNHDELIEQKGKYYQLYTGAFELE